MPYQPYFLILMRYNGIMYFIYVIQHSGTKQIYIGKTNDFKRRLKEHNSNQQKSTVRLNGEWIPIYLEIYRSKEDADRRERALKQHGSNKRWVKSRIKNRLKGRWKNNNKLT